MRASIGGFHDTGARLCVNRIGILGVDGRGIHRSRRKSLVHRPPAARSIRAPEEARPIGGRVKRAWILRVDGKAGAWIRRVNRDGIVAHRRQAGIRPGCSSVRALERAAVADSSVNDIRILWINRQRSATVRR